jgi:hypothetical protein
LLASILDGKGTAMPPVRGKISEEQARGLVAYIKSFAPTAGKSSQKRLEGPASFDERYGRLQEHLIMRHQGLQFLSVLRGNLCQAIIDGGAEFDKTRTASRSGVSTVSRIASTTDSSTPASAREFFQGSSFRFDGFSGQKGSVPRDKGRAAHSRRR